MEFLTRACASAFHLPMGQGMEAAASSLTMTPRHGSHVWARLAQIISQAHLHSTAQSGAESAAVAYLPLRWQLRRRSSFFP